MVEGVTEAVGPGYVADEIHAGGHSDVVAIGDELVRAISARPLGTAVAHELLQTETAVPLELAAELRHGDGKECSPRLVLLISQLIEVMASSKYSTDGVASPAQRCQYQWRCRTSGVRDAAMGHEDITASTGDGYAGLGPPCASREPDGALRAAGNQSRSVTRHGSHPRLPCGHVPIPASASTMRDGTRPGGRSSASIASLDGFPEGAAPTGRHHAVEHERPPTGPNAGRG